MPDFTVTSFVTTSQTASGTVALGGFGYVGSNGEILPPNGYAIQLQGYAELVVLGTVTARGEAVFAFGLSFDITVGNNGQLASSLSPAIIFAPAIGQFSATVRNHGMISGDSSAIRIDAGATSEEVNIVNTGTITAAVTAISAGLGDTSVFRLTNSGTIAAGAVAISADCDFADITNTGDIVGDIYLSSASGFSSIVSNAGTIGGGIETENGLDTLRNSGVIQGVARLGAGNDTLVNTGLINHIVDLGTGDDSASNAGQITGSVTLGTGNDTLVNTGLIQNGVILGDGNDTFTNLGGRVTGSIDGGDGSDTYRIDRDDLAITDTGATGTDIVFSSVTYGLGASIENLTLTGSADIRGFGNDSGNTLTGNLADNLLKGRGGADLMAGGEGDDTLRGGVGSDTLRMDEGDDVLQGGDALGIDVLDCTGLAAPFSINLVLGTASSAVTGNDTISGFEAVLGGTGDDTIIGAAAAEALFGQGGADSLVGGNGNDTITGGFEIFGVNLADTLVGGNGDDIFLFQDFTESSVAVSDLIRDFRPDRDTIDLSAIDANGIGVGNGAFAFGGAAFLAVGQASVRVVQDVPNNITYVDARDTSGSEIDLRITLTGLLTLTAGDFAL